MWSIIYLNLNSCIQKKETFCIYSFICFSIFESWVLSWFFHDFCFFKSWDVLVLLQFWKWSLFVLFLHVELCICRWSTAVIEVNFQWVLKNEYVLKALFSVGGYILEVVHVQRSFLFQSSNPSHFCCFLLWIFLNIYFNNFLVWIWWHFISFILFYFLHSFPIDFLISNGLCMFLLCLEDDMVDNFFYSLLVQELY